MVKHKALVSLAATFLCLFTSMPLHIAAAAPLVSSEKAPLDVWLLVDVSRSMNFKEGHTQIVNVVKDRLREGRDRLRMYVFAEQPCEFPRDRIAELAGFEQNANGEARNVPCRDRVGSEHKTGLLRLFKYGGVLGKSLRSSLEEDRLIDERKRLILILSDGVDDLGGIFRVEKESSKQIAEAKFEKLKDQLPNYKEAAKDLLSLRKVTVGDVYRYFELVFLWIWPSTYYERLFAHKSDLAQKQVRHYWEEIVLSKPNQLPNQFVKKAFYEVPYGKTADVGRTVLEEILENLKTLRSVIIRADCRPPCLNIMEDESRREPVTVDIFTSSTYEPSLPVPLGGLRVRGWERGKDPRRASYFPPLPAMEIPSIAASGPVETNIANDPVKNWYEEGGSLIVVPFLRVEGNDSNGESLRLLLPPKRAQIYRVVPSQRLEIRRRQAIEYTRLSRASLRFVLGNHVGVQFAIPGFVAATIDGAWKRHPASSEKVISEQPQIKVPKSQGGATGTQELTRPPSQVRAIVSYELLPAVKAAPFIPTLFSTDDQWILKEKGNQSPITAVQVRLGLVIICVVIYATLVGGRLWLLWHETRKGLAGQDRSRIFLFLLLGMEVLGFAFYLLAFQIIPAWFDDPWIQKEGLSVAFGNYFVHSIIIIPLICPLIGLIPVLCTSKGLIRFSVTPSGPTLLPWVILEQVLVSWLGLAIYQAAGAVAALAFAVMLFLLWYFPPSKPQEDQPSEARSRRKLIVLALPQITLGVFTVGFFAWVLWDLYYNWRLVAG